jgi:hypothetical protein
LEDDLYGNFVQDDESPIESINNEKLDIDRINKLVEEEDYM